MYEQKQFLGLCTFDFTVMIQAPYIDFSGIINIVCIMFSKRKHNKQY